MDTTLKEERAKPRSLTDGAKERLPWWGSLVLYSQYIIIAMLVLGAVVLRLVYGQP